MAASVIDGPPAGTIVASVHVEFTRRTTKFYQTLVQLVRDLASLEHGGQLASSPVRSCDSRRTAGHVLTFKQPKQRLVTTISSASDPSGRSCGHLHHSIDEDRQHLVVTCDYAEHNDRAAAEGVVARICELVRDRLTTAQTKRRIISVPMAERLPRPRRRPSRNRK